MCVHGSFSDNEDSFTKSLLACKTLTKTLFCYSYSVYLQFSNYAFCSQICNLKSYGFFTLWLKFSCQFAENFVAFHLFLIILLTILHLRLSKLWVSSFFLIATLGYFYVHHWPRLYTLCSFENAHVELSYHFSILNDF